MDAQAIQAVLTAHRREAQFGTSNRLVEQAIGPALKSAHKYDEGPTGFTHFAPLAPTGQIITGTVGGADVDLWATVQATAEAGFIVIDESNSRQWAMTGGAGGSAGWGVVALEWGLAAPGPSFKADYTAVTGGAQNYGAIDSWNVRNEMFWYKPLHGRTINASGGGITAHLVVRPLGVASAVVPWMGADLTGIGPDVCQMIQKMVLQESENFGPVWPKKLFKPAGGRKQFITKALGGGRMQSVLDFARGLIPGQEIPR